MSTQSTTLSPSKNASDLVQDGPGSALATVQARTLSSTLTGWLTNSTAAVHFGAALRHLDSSLARQANAATSVLSMIRNRYEDRRRWRAYQRNVIRWKLAGV